MNRADTFEVPYGVERESPMWCLIRDINTELRAHGQHLCWFASRKSTHPANVTVSGAIFPIGVRTSTRSRECIGILVSWPWCPRVPNSAGNVRYDDLSISWVNYEREHQYGAFGRAENADA